MPKSKSNSRPDNSSQKKQTKRDKEALKRTPGNASFEGTGPGRKNTSAGESAQATRKLLMDADKEKAANLRKKYRLAD